MSDDPKNSSNKDLTSLTDTSAAEADFSITPDAASSSPLEGLEDLLAPISPTLTGSDTAPVSITDDSMNLMADELAEEALPMPSLDETFQQSGTDATSSFESATDAELMAPEFEAASTVAIPVVEKIAEKLSEKLATPTLAEYSDQLAPAAELSAASTPYSLLIEGFLKVHEREILMQILARENLGIREVELEPQFEAGKILIPRVSEYVGVVLVQALRNASVRMRLGPSERIYTSTHADDEDALIYHPAADSEVMISEAGEHPADRILLSPDAEVKGRNILEALDTLHSSMNLKASQMATAHSPKFQEAMETLKRQLKFQAHHRGANALLSFKYELHEIEGQAVYKLVVQAQAVRMETEV